MTFLILCGLSITAFKLFYRHDTPVTDAYVVILNYDGHTQTVPSREPTVRALLQRLDIPLHPGDVVEPSKVAPINQDDFRINIYRAVPVEIVDGTSHHFAYSAATTPRSIALQAGVSLYPEDGVTTKPVTNFISGGAIGEQVIVQRSVPVSLNLYGTPLTLRTRAKTVGDLLHEKGIKLAKADEVVPTTATPITPNLPIYLVRNGTKLENVSEQIAMPIQTVEDPNLSFGTSAIRQAGSPGEQVTTYQDILKNGQIVGRTPIQAVVTVAPVTEIVVQGTNLSGIKGDMALAGIAPGDYQYADYIISNESGWCPTKAQGEHYCPAIPDDAMTPNGYGLCQATPGYKMETAGGDWQTNPVTQLRWCNGYAQSHYGGWYNAYIHWVNHRWW
ncbi:MAG TPA: ubiquitin-like domain-containing protein [Candidatus Saccharimonadales bacterium]